MTHFCAGEFFCRCTCGFPVWLIRTNASWSEPHQLRRRVIQQKVPFRARCQSNPTANQGGFFLPGRGMTVLMKTVIRASFPFMTNSCASSERAKHKSDQLSHYPQLSVINYQPLPRLNDGAHPEVPEDTVSLKSC